jgi:hypothetical protein
MTKAAIASLPIQGAKLMDEKRLLDSSVIILRNPTH